MELALHPEFLKLSKRRRYLVGISGGRDSVALLHTLLDHGYHNMVLCHLNHQLRGKESGKDATFVRRLAKKYDLSCEIGNVNVSKLMKKNGESMELAARNARHRFFYDCAKAYRCDRVLLAHHADDQAETILFNLLRGSAGLKGMNFHTEHIITNKRLNFIRPLLELTRKEIDAYLSHQKIKYREDESNSEPVAARNRIRNEALPLLEEIMNRDIRPALLRAEKISTNREKALLDILDGYELEDPQGRLFLPKLKSLAASAQATAIQIYLRKKGIPDINRDLLDRCQRLIEDLSISKVNLPGNQFFRRKAKRLFIE
ncbi:MAG: tRNA lysidine(34) synthetase TilS [Akkermansiaceae bacterium]